MGIVRTSFQEAIRAAVDGDHDAFVTLEAVQDADAWVQLKWDCINAAYPSNEEPGRLLAMHGIALPEEVELADWEAGKYVTFEHGAEPLEPLVQFVEAYLATVLKVSLSDGALKASQE